jgi:hypothetical protein
MRPEQDKLAQAEQKEGNTLIRNDMQDSFGKTEVLLRK